MSPTAESVSNTRKSVKVESPNVIYTPTHIESKYVYNTTDVEVLKDRIKAVPRSTEYTFRTARKVPKLGVMLIGWGGNNGSTVTAACIANKKGMTWKTKDGVHKANYYGSLTQASTLLLGSVESGDSVYVPFESLLPMVNPNDIVFDGWDISSWNLADAMERAKVLEYDLQRQLRPYMEGLKPRPSIYYSDFIAANQAERADNVIEGSDKNEHLNRLRCDIRDFKAKSGVEKVIVLWTANTERHCDIRTGLNDTADNLLASIKRSDPEVSPSTIFAVASILEGCAFINGSPQNTCVPGVVDLASREKVYLGGDDFKSGQTKLKSVLVDFLVNTGIKPTSIVSYNHLGNNDGMNLSAPQQFRSKEISKSNVVDDMVASNRILYKEAEKPDHCVVIKYVPYVGDSKRAMDEYTSQIMMGGHNTISIHNTCEDSLLASPIILDLVILTELCQRINFRVAGQTEFQPFHSILSILSYMLKAPMVPDDTPLVNALFSQRACIENIMRACVGLAPVNHMLLEHKHSIKPSARISTSNTECQQVAGSDPESSSDTEIPVKQATVDEYADRKPNRFANGIFQSAKIEISDN